MKQPKDSASPVLSTSEPSPARYRLEAPTRVSLPLAELEWAIPAEARTPHFQAQQEIDLPCAEIFTSAVPKITCARLAELHPRYFHAAQLPEAEILLPPAPLALNYRLIEVRERPAQPPAPAQPRATSSAASPAPAEKAPPAPEAEPAPSPSKFWPPKPQPAQAKAPETAPASKISESPTTTPPVPKEEAAKPAPPASPEPSQPVLPPVDAAAGKLSESEPAKASRPFSFFGLFRRKPAPSVPVEAPSIEPAPATGPAQKPIDAQPAGQAAKQPAPKEPAKKEPSAQATPGQDAKKETSPASKKEAAPVELVPVSTESSDVLGNQEGLQKVFLTKEKLSLKQFVTLCGGLSGVQSCLLAQGSVIIGSHQPPANLDLVSLSANALQMLEDMRRSANKMGLGAIPAVTIHSEKGPVTFFPSQDLCLLVLQDDKGLAPGVREKLETAVAALAQAGLPRQIGR